VKNYTTGFEPDTPWMLLLLWC